MNSNTVSKVPIQMSTPSDKDEVTLNGNNYRSDMLSEKSNEEIKDRVIKITEKRKLNDTDKVMRRGVNCSSTTMRNKSQQIKRRKKKSNTSDDDDEVSCISFKLEIMFQFSLFNKQSS